MLRTILLFVALQAGVQFTTPANVQVNSVQISSLPDGGASIQVYATITSDDGSQTLQSSPVVQLNGGGPAQTCAIGLFNAAQKVALNSIKLDGGAAP